MAGTISKRQQARNERMLQDLLRTVPGNDRCADCAAKNPGWASWNLGVFLCMRCAALHRKLGTHVSKVKSLSMDSWSAEQVENMKKVGNVASNKVYNPKNARPDIPVDADEVDAAIEKYIRQKYDTRALSDGNRANAPAARQNTGSTGTDMGSWSEEPPELPPKPSKKFGFSLRSSSSTFPRQKPERFTPPISPTYSGGERSMDLPSPKRENKPSRLFGMKITTVDNNFNAKLSHLRDMGFPDNGKNTEILKSMNGNLDKAVEALVRLGEHTKPISRTITPQPSRILTPVSMGSSGGNGITVEKKAANNNPWEIQEEVKPALPPRASSVPPQTTSANNSWNPFLQPQPQPTLENSFQNLSMSATSSPGPQSYANQQSIYQNPQPTNPWQTSQPQQSFQQAPQQQQQQPQQQQAVYGQQLAPLQTSSGNPFMQQQQSQTLSPVNPWAPQSAPIQQSSNPFGTPWQQPQQSVTQQAFAASPQPIYGQQSDFFSAPQQAAQQPQQPQFQAQQPQYAASTASNPWAQNLSQPSQPMQQQQQSQPQQATIPPQQQYQQMQPQQTQQPQQQFGQFGQQQQQFAPQQPARHDKSSILALYNYPQFAPPRPLQTLPENGTMPQQQPTEIPQRSATMPIQAMSGSMNPFGQQPGQPQFAHASKESVDFQGFANSGRHSPDAFAGLSARYMR